LRLLADTHVLLWAMDHPHRLSKLARSLLTDIDNELFFSPLSIWEVSIKGSLGRKDFHFDPSTLRRGLLNNGYAELPVTSHHAIAVQTLPLLHKDPIDRLLIAQATVEDITLLTSDRQVAKYPGPIRKV
jgi:PIN domain nuclease of toxin-antitoxin system